MAPSRFGTALIVAVAIGAATAAAGDPGLAPEVSGVAPSPAAPSPSPQTITVSGRNFSDQLTLLVTTPSGEVHEYRDAALSSQRDTSFAAAVTLAATGTYRLTVTNPDGRTSSAFPLPVRTATIAPVINAIEPQPLSKSMSPQVITVIGSAFLPGLTAMVTDPAGSVATIEAGDVGQVSPRSVRLTVTLELSGDYAIVVTNPSGSVSNSFGFKVDDWPGRR